MKSKELARFAGVSVRTLRHYHKLGLLEEPPRLPNGYREYRTVDAVRLLRIKHLAGLGFSLHQIKEMLDDGSFTAEDTLAALDAELAEEAKRIEEQRRIIAQLKEAGSDPDVPPAFSSHMKRLREGGAREKMLDLERSGLYLASQPEVTTAEEAQEVARFMDFIAEEGKLDAYIDLTERIYSLTPESPQAERERLVDEVSQWFAALLEKGSAVYGWFGEQPEVGNALESNILDAFEKETLNSVQVEVSQEIVERAKSILHDKLTNAPSK